MFADVAIELPAYSSKTLLIWIGEREKAKDANDLLVFAQSTFSCGLFTISSPVEDAVGLCIQNTLCWLCWFLLSSLDAYLLLSYTANFAFCSSSSLVDLNVTKNN